MKESHFYQALKQFSGEEPPKFMVGVTTSEYLSNFSDEQSEELVEWALSSNVPWCTGQGMIDSAITLVRDAVDNGNIVEGTPPEQDLCLYNSKHNFHYFGDQKVRRCNNCNCLESEDLK